MLLDKLADFGSRRTYCFCREKEKQIIKIEREAGSIDGSTSINAKCKWHCLSRLFVQCKDKPYLSAAACVRVKFVCLSVTAPALKNGNLTDNEKLSGIFCLVLLKIANQIQF